MNTCIMPIKKEWFEKLLSGEKTIEYRENKQYWWVRLRLKSGIVTGTSLMIKNHTKYILFKNGYRKNCRKALAEIERIHIIDSGKATDLKTDKPVIHD